MIERDNIGIFYSKKKKKEQFANFIRKSKLMLEKIFSI